MKVAFILSVMFLSAQVFAQDLLGTTKPCPFKVSAGQGACTAFSNAGTACGFGNYDAVQRAVQKLGGGKAVGDNSSSTAVPR